MAYPQFLFQHESVLRKIEYINGKVINKIVCIKHIIYYLLMCSIW